MWFPPKQNEMKNALKFTDANRYFCGEISARFATRADDDIVSHRFDSRDVRNSTEAANSKLRTLNLKSSLCNVIACALSALKSSSFVVVQSHEKIHVICSWKLDFFYDFSFRASTADYLRALYTYYIANCLHADAADRVSSKKSVLTFDLPSHCCLQIHVYCPVKVADIKFRDFSN